MKNKQVLIDSLPTNKLEATNYRINESEMGRLGDEEIRVRTIAFAITAGTRAGLQGSASYAGAPTAGRVMNATGVGEVVESNDTRISVGDRVLGPLGWQSYSDHRAETLNKIDSTRNPEEIYKSLKKSKRTSVSKHQIPLYRQLWCSPVRERLHTSPFRLNISLVP